MKRNKSLFKTIKYSLNGLSSTIKLEGNMVFHIITGLIVCICAYLFKISFTEWIICMILISLVITAELINTAIENAIDLYTMESNKYAKIAKDIAAGAVLVCAITATVIGLMIFLPKLNF